MEPDRDKVEHLETNLDPKIRGLTKHTEAPEDQINQRFSSRNCKDSFTEMWGRKDNSLAPPTPPTEVHKAGYQCQMLYKTGMYHLLTCLNKASRSTRCNDNNNISLSALTRSGFGQCTLDPFGKRVTNVNCQQQIKFLQNHPRRDIGRKYGAFKPQSVCVFKKGGNNVLCLCARWYKILSL